MSSLIPATRKWMEMLGYKRPDDDLDGKDYEHAYQKYDKALDKHLPMVEAAALEFYAHMSPRSKVAAPTADLAPLYEALVATGFLKKQPLVKHYGLSEPIAGFEYVYSKGPNLTHKAMHFISKDDGAHAKALEIERTRIAVFYPLLQKAKTLRAKR